MGRERIEVFLSWGCRRGSGDQQETDSTWAPQEKARKQESEKRYGLRDDRYCEGSAEIGVLSDGRGQGDGDQRGLSVGSDEDGQFEDAVIEREGRIGEGDKLESLLAGGP